MSKIVGVVLAAGASERMGEPKMLLRYGDSTILNATITAMERSSVDHLVVVTGCESERIERSITSERATVVRNPDYRLGNMSSFLTGVDAASGGDGFLLVAGDLPTIDTAAIDTVAKVWRATKPWAVVAEYRDRVAHPFLLSRKAVEHVRSAHGEKVLWRALVDPGDGRTVRLPLPFDAPLDVNTQADYEKLSGGA